MTLEQRAQALAQYAASCCQWLHDGTPRHYTDRCEAKILEGLRDVRNHALGEAEQVIRRAPSLDENGYITEKSAAITAIRALIDTPASEAPMTDNSDPTSCDDAEVMRLWRECGLPEYFLGNGGTNRKLVAFAERVRSEADDPRDAEIERLREVAPEKLVTGIGNGKFATFNVAGRMPDTDYGAKQCVVLDKKGNAYAVILTPSGWRMHSGPVKLYGPNAAREATRQTLDREPAGDGT